MTCDESRERFVQALYDELTGDDNTLFARHLAGCEACSAELAAMKETLSVMDKRPRAEGPDDRFWERLAPRLGEPPPLTAEPSRLPAPQDPAPRRPARRPAAMPAWAFGIAAAVILACGIYLGRMYFGAPAQGPAPAASGPASAASASSGAAGAAAAAAAPETAKAAAGRPERPVKTL